jgi:hypothetical protein
MFRSVSLTILFPCSRTSLPRLIMVIILIFLSLSLLDVVKDVRVSCNSDDITLTISTYLDSFNGMIYPKGLSKNSSCMTEYIQSDSTIKYTLALRSCNTMNTDVVRILVEQLA